MRLLEGEGKESGREGGKGEMIRSRGEGTSQERGKKR